ncbi:MAG: hypothetical protein HQL50_11105 [Magnetococcales bacterium]|nr:hypothetical protein [Magnetococcales bacterium]
MFRPKRLTLNVAIIAGMMGMGLVGCTAMTPEQQATLDAAAADAKAAREDAAQARRDAEIARKRANMANKSAEKSQRMFQHTLQK